MKKATWFVVAMLCLGLTGCNKDAEINAFLNEWDSITSELVEKINAGDVDGAKTLFDAKKGMLKTKWAAANNARKFQVSDTTKMKMRLSREKNSKALDATMSRLIMLKEPPDKAKFDIHKAIIDEYDDIFRYPLATL